MPPISRDQEIVTALAEKIDVSLETTEYDGDGNLLKLDLSGLDLSQIPVELGQLTNLQQLYLSNNQLSQVPVELGQLTNLQVLLLDNNPSLLTLPPEIVARGTTEMLTFLRELQEKSVTRYEAKLLVVGEGGTGKSSLLRALRNETFVSNLSTTHGIEVGTLEAVVDMQDGMESTFAHNIVEASGLCLLRLVKSYPPVFVLAQVSQSCTPRYLNESAMIFFRSRDVRL